MAEEKTDFESPAVDVVSDEELKKTQGKKEPSKRKGGVSIIRPVAGSRLMTRVANVVDNLVEATDDKGQTISQSLGTWQGERFADSKQNFRPEYDTALGQFDIRKPNGELWDQDDANACLKIFPLSYEEGDPRAGQPIEHCNIHAPDDPYFRHRGLSRFATEGELTLNEGIQKESMLLQMYAGNQDVAFDTGEEFIAGDLRSLITNPEVQEEKAEKLMNDNLAAAQAFLTMQDDRSRMIDMLRMFGVDTPEEASTGTVRAELYKYSLDAGTIEEGASYQRRFITYSELAKPDLHMRGVISLALGQQTIRSKGGNYFFADLNLGKLYSEVVEFFKRNEDDFVELKRVVERR